MRCFLFSALLDFGVSGSIVYEKEKNFGGDYLALLQYYDGFSTRFARLSLR